MKNKIRVLIIEDSWLEAKLLEDLLSIALREADYAPLIHSAPTKSQATQFLTHHQYDLVVFDIDLDKRKAGLELLKEFSSQVTLPVISTSRRADEIVDQAYEQGCEHFITKPINEKKIKLIVEEYIKKTQASAVDKTIRSRYITNDPDTIEQIFKIKNCGTGPIHIQGETGVGKQVLAELTHDIVRGTNRAFIERNCSSKAGDLADSFLFGHKKGSFTGADRDTKGIFELADGGTLFLDEIDKTPLAFQAKLLKVVEQKLVTPVGSEESIKVDFVLVTASSSDMNTLVAEGKFLPDLWERLQGEVVYIKPLRERPQDIESQLKHFIKNHETGRLFVVSDPAMSFLKKYDWPGNTRELTSLVDRMQRRRIKVVGLEHLENLRRKVIRQNYKLANPLILEMVKKNGYQKTLDMLSLEIFDHFYSSNMKNHRQTMKQMSLSTRRFYKLQGELENGEQGGSV